MSLENQDSRVAASETDSPNPPGLGENMGQLTQDLRGLAHDLIELITLEARHSVNTLLRMGVISIISAVALVSTWLALLGSAGLGLVGIGLSPAIAMLLIAAANLLLALAGWLRVRHLSHWLGWSATQRAIKPADSSEQKQDIK